MDPSVVMSLVIVMLLWKGEKHEANCTELNLVNKSLAPAQSCVVPKSGDQNV